MQTHRTIRYHLYPASQKKHRQLHRTAGACRYVRDHFVAKLKDEYEYYGESRFNFFTLGKQFTTLRKYCDKWLQGYSAYIVKSSLQPKTFWRLGVPQPDVETATVATQVGQ